MPTAESRLRIGALRHRIRLEASTLTPDATGDPVVTWEPHATVWASIEPLQGLERFAAQQTAGAVDHRVRLRYVDGVVPAMRVVFGPRVFDINAVLNPEERNISLELLCREVVG